MEKYEEEIGKQFRRLFLGSAIVAATNFVVTLTLNLSYLPQFYLISAGIFSIFAVYASLKHFVLCYTISFLVVMIQAFISVYSVGDDCGIQLYLLALILSANYVHLTNHSLRFKRAFIIGVGCANIAAYMLVDEIIDKLIAPLKMMEESSEVFFTFINVLGSLSFLLYVSSIFAKGYQKEFEKLNDENHKLERESNLDRLTGLMNRRGIESYLHRRYREWKLIRSPFTVAIGDVDHFKRINDEFGHDAGDFVLSRLGRLMKDTVPKYAMVSRWGGEEFLFAFPAQMENACEFLEKLRSEIEAYEFDYQDKHLKITLTIGAAEAADAESLDDLVRLADRRLYLGKRAGRNRIVSGDE
ncbi:MAG TPA: GGDEF domain-containing protein [Candidatus Mediterraneibacter norfolkensis]|nr:GGDEF domain-containing protein [Candidatus Mediterraneibacter norfolkensis]